jgi:protein-S-isoprenylcysteine O-methyltransferase Ste14
VSATTRPLLARWRVPIGFVLAGIVLALAQPTPFSLAAGTALALCGEAVRLWAAGHLEKGREVTRSGPYRLTRHPLYLGSALMGGGLAIAAASVPVALIVLVYFVATVGAAIRSEETFLRARFGDEYDAYAAGVAVDRERRFSFARVRRNREYRAVAGLVLASGLLALKVLYLR